MTKVSPPKSPFPYKVVSRLACENRLMRVKFEDFDHNRERLRNYLVVEPQHAAAKKVSGVAVLPLWQGKVGMLRLFRHALAEGSWEIPRGFLDPAEKPGFSALRELDEETGLTCHGKDLIDLGHITPEPGIIRARIALFAAKNCVRQRSFRKDEAGHMALHFMPLARVAAMVADSRIQDPCTLVAWYRFASMK